ncbi:hypothetical protein PIB30_085225 [Stylosanthes scabra]|uniref:Uncharacterized protein n=1 Tax=Stylosanthes scabra TaxID=79078 RepID=A0ABU6US89_9FABA|nr:hypothetical protein [Stylosanthes scabra]
MAPQKKVMAPRKKGKRIKGGRLSHSTTASHNTTTTSASNVAASQIGTLTQQPYLMIPNPGYMGPTPPSWPTLGSMGPPPPPVPPVSVPTPPTNSEPSVGPQTSTSTNFISFFIRECIGS